MLLFSDRNNPYEHLHFLGLPSTPWRIPRPSLLEQKQRKKKKWKDFGIIGYTVSITESPATHFHKLISMINRYISAQFILTLHILMNMTALWLRLNQL